MNVEPYNIHAALTHERTLVLKLTNGFSTRYDQREGYNILKTNVRHGHYDWCLLIQKDRKLQSAIFFSYTKPQDNPQVVYVYVNENEYIPVDYQNGKTLYRKVDYIYLDHNWQKHKEAKDQFREFILEFLTKPDYLSEQDRASMYNAIAHILTKAALLPEIIIDFLQLEDLSNWDLFIALTEKFNLNERKMYGGKATRDQRDRLATHMQPFIEREKKRVVNTDDLQHILNNIIDHIIKDKEENAKMKALVPGNPPARQRTPFNFFRQVLHQKAASSQKGTELSLR